MGFALWFGLSTRGNDADGGDRSRPAKLRLVSDAPSTAAAPIAAALQISPALADLSARIRNGDHEAFTTFVNDYYERATRVAYAVVHSVDVAQDIAQDVFIRLWDRRDTLDATRLTAAYVLTAAHHRALDMLKQERIRARYREAPDPTAVIATLGEEDAILDHTAVNAALATLPDRWQLALRLRLQEQVAVPELAAALGISANAAHQLLHRAIRELRRRLGAP